MRYSKTAGNAEASLAGVGGTLYFRYLPTNTNSGLGFALGKLVIINQSSIATKLLLSFLALMKYSATKIMAILYIFSTLLLQLPAISFKKTKQNKNDIDIFYLKIQE